MKYRASTKEDVKWFLEKIQYKAAPDLKGIVAYDDDGISGMVAFDNWALNSVHAHVASNNARCTMGLWKEVKRYLREHGYGVIIAQLPAHRDKAVRLIIKGFKFQELARIKDGWDKGSDIIIAEYRL